MKAQHAASVLLALGASTALARLCAVSGLIDCFSWVRGDTCTAVWRCPGPVVAVEWDDHDVQEQIVVGNVPEKDWTCWREAVGDQVTSRQMRCAWLNAAMLFTGIMTCAIHFLGKRSVAQQSWMPNQVATHASHEGLRNACRGLFLECGVQSVVER